MLHVLHVTQCLVRGAYVRVGACRVCMAFRSCYMCKKKDCPLMREKNSKILSKNKTQSTVRISCLVAVYECWIFCVFAVSWRFWSFVVSVVGTCLYLVMLNSSMCNKDASARVIWHTYECRHQLGIYAHAQCGAWVWPKKVFPSVLSMFLIF